MRRDSFYSILILFAFMRSWCISALTQDEQRAKFPDCTVDDPWNIGVEWCAYLDEESNTAECGWDGGDCVIEGYPYCHDGSPKWIGNGYCNGGSLNTKERGWDGGDCVVEGYPDCHVDNPEKIGDGICNGNPMAFDYYYLYGYNTAECGWDGGDCEALNQVLEVYPNCYVYYP